MSDEIPVGDVMYVSSKRASEISGYAQDYIGQLARTGQIKATRVGGLWYVLMDSLESYRTGSEQGSIPTATPAAARSDHERNALDSFVSLDGKDYISANRASKITGYNQDYVGQLARSGKILSRQVGKRWYIDQEGLLAHKEEKDSLLAAVQAAAVGIRTIESNVSESQSNDSEKKAPLLTYLREESDLQPQIGKVASTGGSVIDLSPHSSEAERGNEIPIHIVRANPSPVARLINSANVAKRPIRKPKYAYIRIVMVTLGGVLTILMIFFGFKALNLTIGSVDATTLNVKMRMLESGCVRISNSVSEAFENWAAPELIYQRSS